MNLTREDAIKLLETHVQAETLRNHCLATEAIMCALAQKLGADPELWGLVGLLHDLDFEYTRDDPASHGLKTIELLSPYQFPKEATDAILRHNAEALQLRRETPLGYALTSAETITGLIVAAALVHPDKRLQSLAAKSVVKRMKSKDFARNVNRAHVALCEELNIPQTDFIALSLEAMTAIGAQLGL
jgi:putative nucleotidyltransferase with HDIG domain